ncbi:MAG: hypothetical protein ACE5JO_04300 [Candidatus Binatia bacterium]
MKTSKVLTFFSLLAVIYLQPAISWPQGSPDPKLVEAAKKEGRLVY